MDVAQAEVLCLLIDQKLQLRVWLFSAYGLT